MREGGPAPDSAPPRLGNATCSPYPLILADDLTLAEPGAGRRPIPRYVAFLQHLIRHVSMRPGIVAMMDGARPAVRANPVDSCHMWEGTTWARNGRSRAMRTLIEETRAATDLERLWPAGVILEDGAAKAITRVEELDWRATEAVPALVATRAAVKATILFDSKSW